jgi:murein DD-endopeptidase MepM/ murein hydrolase activator NlpD
LFIIVVALCHYLIHLFCLGRQDEDLRSYQEEDFAYDFFIPKNIVVQTEVDDSSKVRGMQLDNISTASGEEEGVQPVEIEEDELVADWPADVEEDDIAGETWEDEGANLSPVEDSDNEQWEDEIDSDEPKEDNNDYAKRAHTLLLDNGSYANDETVKRLSSGPSTELHKLLLEDGNAQQRLSLIEGSTAAMAQRRLLLENGLATDENLERLLLEVETATATAENGMAEEQQQTANSSESDLIQLHDAPESQDTGVGENPDIEQEEREDEENQDATRDPGIKKEQLEDTGDNADAWNDEGEDDAETDGGWDDATDTSSQSGEEPQFGVGR